MENRIKKLEEEQKKLESGEYLQSFKLQAFKSTLNSLYCYDDEKDELYYIRPICFSILKVQMGVKECALFVKELEKIVEMKDDLPDSIGLEGNQMGDDGCKIIADWIAKTKGHADEISLNDNNLTDLSCDYLTQALEKNQTIGWMYLLENPQITPERLAEFNKFLDARFDEKFKDDECNCPCCQGEEEGKKEEEEEKEFDSDIDIGSGGPFE